MVEKTVLKCRNCGTYTLHYLYEDSIDSELWVCAECKMLMRIEKLGFSK